MTGKLVKLELDEKQLAAYDALTRIAARECIDACQSMSAKMIVIVGIDHLRENGPEAVFCNFLVNVAERLSRIVLDQYISQGMPIEKALMLVDNQAETTKNYLMLKHLKTGEKH